MNLIKIILKENYSVKLEHYDFWVSKFRPEIAENFGKNFISCL